MTDQNLPAERGPDTMSLAASAGIGFGGASGFDLAPQSLGEVVGFAKLMAGAGHAIPKHLRANPGACMAVTIQALGWQMSPFAVALQTYQVGDSIAYMAQVIVAVINTRAGLKNRPLIEYLGEGATRQCRVTFTFKNGDVRQYLSPMFKDIPVKNSPLWKSDPDQQLAYYSQRSAARRYCPEVILGVYDPDELEHAEPLAATQERAAPVSLRARLPGASGGGQGFDPDHVETETKGDVIEGKAAPTPTPAQAGQRDAAIQAGQQAEPGEAGQAMAEVAKTAATEDEAKGDLAAALASLDKKPADDGPAEPEPTTQADAAPVEPEAQVEVQPEPVTDPEPEIDSADDLIRQNAFDDGFNGDAVDAVLIMCETEEEIELARKAHAEGVQARIDKEAAEHEASEAAAAAAQAEEQTRAATPAEIAEAKADAAPEFTDVAGPAPAGEKYLLVTEEPGADGKVTIYRDGEVFSRVPASAAAGKYDRYDGHPQPLDPALASLSGGTGETPAAAEQTQQPEPETMKPNGLYTELAAMESWLQIKPRLTQLYGSAMFKALPEADQAATRAHIFGAVLEMKDRTRDPVDWGADPAAFSLWLDWIAAGSDPDKIDMINGTFQTLQGSKTWKERLTDAQRTTLETRVAGVLAKIRGN